MGSRVASVHFPDKNLAGVPQLLDDLQRLAEDHESADILFVVGRDELPVYAHRIILMARCKSFQTAKRGEICRIPGCLVSPPTAPGTPTPIRLPQFQGETFRQFMTYVYTGKGSSKVGLQEFHIDVAHSLPYSNATTKYVEQFDSETFMEWDSLLKCVILD